jgi:hypothetical protein
MVITDNDDIKFELAHYNMMGYYQWLINLQTDMANKNEILVFLRYEYRDLKQYFSEDILRITSYESFIKVKEEARRNRQIKLYVNEMPKNIRDWYNRGLFSESLKELCYLASTRRHIEVDHLGRSRDMGRDFLYRISKYRSYLSYEYKQALDDLEKEVNAFIYGSLGDICSMDQAFKIIEKIQTENWKVVYKNEISGIVLFRAYNHIGVQQIASDAPWCTKSSEYFRSYVGSREAIKYIALMDYTQDKQSFNAEVGFFRSRQYFEKMAFVFSPDSQMILSAFDNVNRRMEGSNISKLLANKIPKRDMTEIFGKRFVERLSDDDVLEFSKFSINRLTKNDEETTLNFYAIFWAIVLFSLLILGSYLLYSHLVS